jgi:tight adherence protein B
VIIFVVSIILIESGLFAYRNLAATQRARLKKRLQKYTFVENDFGDILKKREYSEIHLLNKFLKMFPLMEKWDKLIIQSNTQYSLGFFLMLSIVLGVCGVFIPHYFLENTPISILIGLISMFLPYVYLVNKRDKRTAKFQAQLHEGLDLIARALRAGHSFNSSMKLAADEFGDPLGTEFDETLDEINFGVSVPDALKSLTERVECSEVKYFVIAVIIQRETGGNLAELIESLAHIIREKFIFEGKVRILSAEGRLSAVILIGLPILIGVWLQISNPDFMKPLFTDPIGHVMLIGAGVLLVLGMIVMKQMVKIEV